MATPLIMKERGFEMSGFTYKGYSTNTILDSKLILATFSALDDVQGHIRDNLIGETTMTRPIPNEYGTQYQNPTFEYCLIKNNNSPFTDEEQITIERWLTSPKFSSPLEIIDCDGNVLIVYDGKFIETNWIVTEGGYAGVRFKFQSASPYPYRNYTKTFEIRGNNTIVLNCESDELEEYTYPTIEFYAPSSTNNVTITNTTDDNNSLTIRALDRLRITMDCNHCILRDETSGVIDFDDVGWADVGNIYWLRLLSGNNILSCSGNVDLTISYKAVVKKVGDWL